MWCGIRAAAPYRNGARSSGRAAAGGAPRSGRPPPIRFERGGTSLHAGVGKWWRSCRVSVANDSSPRARDPAIIPRTPHTAHRTPHTAHRTPLRSPKRKGARRRLQDAAACQAS
ncbi:hypothetical protein DIE01_04745 [Burkholderia sp. Bp8990]|nr:hypothetical protein DIE01_04745 [Burkholderia sp. Bp8990]